ncbi:CRISPR-associated endonuclease Cas3'' [Legionella brunensis]|uniref:CRISPR-associated nuclease/helicase Cas3 subtype I-F/YPEST n=1 Tax=Legionella brunensis TaxID=29422 RepID=A0A0W0ST82_9GAMM|nr:CRISPR-associated endonuclease Cas3'' [Legionella brunensis]KTC86582.1 CRISPR-associated nuclease/helicase Cas3 subtype I-F/YPEST [Legionella brunensis]
MMVVFVSQCQKKALSRTRRVLDAFADRIGDNTWKTVITQDGLSSVKKLLRKTATKNTAVSCHWIRARSRAELVWVVGCRHAFNHLGVVPVNFTSMEVIMDKLPIETEYLIANKQAQSLSHHLFAVGYVAYCLLEKIGIVNQKLKQSAFISGILHDIGKIDPEFQRWVCSNKHSENIVPEDGVHIDAPKKFSFENHPRHHELSWLLSESLLAESQELSKDQRVQIVHGIYWHHTKPFRKEDKFIDAEKIFAIFKASLANNNIKDIYTQARAVLNDVSMFASKYNISNLLPDFAKTFELTDRSLPKFKKYDNILDDLERYKLDIRHNALNNLVRSVVISSDRLVSSCPVEELEEYLAEGSLKNLVDNLTEEDGQLLNGIRDCLDGFERRFPLNVQNRAQSQAAKKLAELRKIASINELPNISVLQGPAGCGKTKISLEWALLTEAKKIIWVCPRVQVCLGLLNDLTAFDYLPDCKIEIFTGEYKKILRGGIAFDDAPDTEEDSYFSGDIVITTIDQAVNSVITHHKVTALIDLMQAHVVFDEFHELIHMPAFNLLFAELIEAKKARGAQANTLLVSATPHYFFINKFLDIPAEDIVPIDSFNNSRYQIEFQVYNEKEMPSPLISEHQGKNTFVISNTAQDAQLGYLKHHNTENSVLLHSKYTKQDKAFWFNQVFESFKRDGNRNFDVLRCGPIVQASLNISCERMLTELTCAENWLQRLGRLDRFGINSEINRYTTVLPDNIDKEGKQTSNCAKFLNQLCIWQSTKAWFNFLKDKLYDNREVNINQLYKYYVEFFANPTSQKAIKEDFLMALKKSVDLINDKVIDPISVPPKSKRADNVVKISANSLRGDNRFVQMAVCRITNSLEVEVTNDYVYSEEFNPIAPQPNLTASVESMRGYGDDNNNLVQFMRKKHHSIKYGSGYKQARNEWVLIKEACSPEAPIYLSYTPKDLEQIGGMSAAHQQAVYYVITNKQPVGAMSIDKLKQHFQRTDISK